MKRVERIRAGLRWVVDLGVWTLDRGEDSCVWKTKACERCYNRDIARFAPWLQKCWGTGGSDDQRWDAATSDIFRGLDCVRLCTRGEPIVNVGDMARIAEWASDNPATIFWLTTRAWQRGIDCDYEYELNVSLMSAMAHYLLSLSNVRLLLSVDPYTVQHLPLLQLGGWSTNYFGSELPHPDDGVVFRCPKTWQGMKGACGKCFEERRGCFSDHQVDVWLKEHGSHSKPSPQLPLGFSV